MTKIVQKMAQVAQKYADLLSAEERNQEYAAQRVQMWHFFMFFYQELRSLLNEMEGEIRTLKEKGLHKQVLKMFVQSYRDLLEILKSTDKEKPYEMANKFVNYILEKPHRSELENLDFLIKHHLKNNQVETIENQYLGQSTFNVLANLNSLAHQVKKFMETNPEMPIPGGSTPPPTMLNPEISFEETKTNPEELTNPAIPSRKKDVANF